MASRKAIPAALKQKMAASVVGTGASLLPGVKESPAVVEEKELIPSIDELIADKEDLDTLRALVANQLVLKAAIDPLKLQLEGKDGKGGVNGRIKLIVREYGIDKAVCDGASIICFPTSRSTIDAMKLLAAGVPQEVIDACTDTSTSYTLKVTGPKQ